MSSAIVERSHAILSSIEETHASKPQAQSSLILSKGILWSGKSRTWYKIWCDIALLIEKLTEQFIGVLCVQSYDVSSKVKVREPSLTLTGRVHRGSNKLWFQCCTNYNNVVLFLRAIQGYSGGELIAPELMNHVAFPLRWEEFQYDRGSSFILSNTLQAGLIEGGKTPKEGRQTVFFTPLDPFGDDTEEEYDDLSTPRKVHYKNKRKVSQYAVYWVNWGKSTRERITILADTVSCHFLS